MAKPAPPPRGGYAIGIDLGTTYSCVGVWKDGAVTIIPSEEGHRTIPSYVAFTSSALLTGHAAKQQAHLNPANTVYDSKRLIGRRYDEPSTQADIGTFPFSVLPSAHNTPLVMVTHRGEAVTYTPEEISSFILQRIKHMAETHLDAPVTSAVITVPAYFSDSQRQATKDAGAIAGLNVLRVINEPTAAAIAYGLSAAPHSSAERNVLIFDLGGGTFDVSLLSIEGGVYEVRSTAGDTHLGGEDFDEKVLDWLIDELVKERQRRGLATTDRDGRCVVRADDRLVRRMRTACEQAKREVSTADSTSITLTNIFPPSVSLPSCPALSTSFSVPFTRAQLESLCSALFLSTLTPVEQVLRDAKLDQRAIHDVVLVGGSTRIPRIRDLLSAFFQHSQPLCTSIDPDEAVAYGAAVQAALLTGAIPASSCIASNILLIDVIPMSVGVEVAGGVMNVLIPRNSTIPCRRTQTFTTHEDAQSSVEVKVYEGERLRTADNILLGVFEVAGLPARRRGEVRVDVVFEVDVNGIMQVSAVERESGVAGGITVSSDRGMRADEIRALVSDMQQRKVAEGDDSAEAVLRSKSALEGFVLDVGRRVEDCGGLGDAEKVRLVGALREVEEWIRQVEGRGEGVDERCYEDKQRQIEGVVMPALMKAGMMQVTRRMAKAADNR